MLKYLVETSGTLALPAVVAAFLLALCGRSAPGREIWLLRSFLLCCAVSLVTAGLKLTTRAVNQELLVLHLSCAGAVISLLLLALVPLAPRLPKTVSVLASVAVFCLFYEQLPVFMVAPAGFAQIGRAHV